MAFYNPKLLLVRKTPVIFYADQGVEEMLQRSKHITRMHLTQLKNEETPNPEVMYQITFSWALQNSLMTDLWTFKRNPDTSDSVPLSDGIVFRGFDELTEAELKVICRASGNTHIVLGREEEHRRKFSDIRDYLCTTRPELPEYLCLHEDFFLRD